MAYQSKWDKVEIIGSPDKDDFVALYSLKGQVAAAVATGRMRATAILLIKMAEPLSMAAARLIVEEVAEAGS